MCVKRMRIVRFIKSDTVLLAATNLRKDTKVKQGILSSSLEVDGLLRSALLIVEKELDLARLGAKLQEEIRSKIESRQKEHFLREQLKADRQTYLQKIADVGMPEEAENRARRELERMSLLPTEAPEYHVIRNYLKWLVELPWSKMSSEEMDIGKAARILDGDHHGLKEVKERIVEFLGEEAQAGSAQCDPLPGRTSWRGQDISWTGGGAGHGPRVPPRRGEFHRVALGGLLCIVGGSHFLVELAIVIARGFGVSEWVIGVTIVAAGTYAPKLATSMAGVINGRYALSAGNVISSDIFNLFGVLGLTGMLRPMEIDVMARMSSPRSVECCSSYCSSCAPAGACRDLRGSRSSSSLRRGGALTFRRGCPAHDRGDAAMANSTDNVAKG
jgi:hypothetical protein